MFDTIRKISKLLKVIDKVEIREDSDQIRIVFKKNLLISTDESILFSSGKHMILKTGSLEPGLLFLNPSIESVDNVDSSVDQSKKDQEHKRRKINQIDYSSDNDKDCKI